MVPAMRRLVLIALIGLALAAPAAAAASKLAVVKSAGLRGVQSASTGAAPPASTPPSIIQSRAASNAQAASGDAMQCRAACAQTYYFCAANGDDDCPGRWAQCSAGCNASQTTQPYMPSL
jgi:hypothetical protein